MTQKSARAWYDGENRDALFYILIAVFFLEMIIGVAAFFYGIVRATPETPGGPPVARFPWLAWGIASLAAPAALALIVHATGSLLSGKSGENAEDDPRTPERMKRFYAAVRHAPAIVILGAILLLGASLFFIDGAFGLMRDVGLALAPHLPWLIGGVCGLLAFCFLAHAFFVYRRAKLEREYAWRREVLEKTGMIIAEKNSAIVADERRALPDGAEVIDIERSLPRGEEDEDSRS